jgi:hypothetical protein
METTSSPSQEAGPSLRPRVVDVSEMDYAEVASHVDSDTNAYFERKHGRTTLVIR